MTDNEQSKHANNMFVRAIIESQQQQEIYERRKKKQENEKAKNNWKTENTRRKEVKTTAKRTARQGTTRVGTEGRGHTATDTQQATNGGTGKRHRQDRKTAGQDSGQPVLETFFQQHHWNEINIYTFIFDE